MNAADSAEPSPQVLARTAGALYLIVIATGIFAELFVRQRLVVAREPAATAANILQHQHLFRWGFASDLFGVVCVVPLILLLYEIFKVVNRRIALLAVFFSLIGSAVQSVALVGHFAPLLILKPGTFLSANLASSQVQALLALRLQSTGYAIALAFFGGTMVARGYLIVKSALVPRVIGVFLVVEGVCYFANTFTNFLWPGAASAVFSVLLISGLAEIALCLWLLIKGVNESKWRELEAAAKRAGSAIE